MKKALIYTNNQEYNEGIILNSFSSFECYIGFQFECGLLARVLFKEKTKDKCFVTTEISRMTFGTEIPEFYKAIYNFIRANNYSLYLLNVPGDEIEFVIASCISDLDFCYISPNNNVVLIEEDFSYIPDNDKCLVEFVVFRKDNIKIELYSNENLGFEEPHVHVLVNNERSYKISLLDGYSILRVYNRANSKTEKKIIEIIRDNITRFRNKWNEFNNKVKFATDENGDATSIIKK